MRSDILSLVLAVAVSGLAPHTTIAATQSENQAQQIASNLKQSGKLKDYRVGVKYEDGVTWLTGTVTSPEQKRLAEQIARNSAGVNHVVSKLEVDNTSSGAISDQEVQSAGNMRFGPQRSHSPRQQTAPQQRRRRPVARSPQNNMPVPYARTARGVRPVAYSRQAQYCPNGGCVTGGGMAGGLPGGMAAGMGGGMGPAPMGNGAPAAVGQSVSYDNPQMPGYAWPSYAASPNYAALTYPKQYSPSAWPYIGPFYPYPQVPLGWRKVTLEWDDGWWFLDFKDCKHCK